MTKYIIFYFCFIVCVGLSAQDKTFNIERYIPNTSFKVKGEVGVWYKMSNCSNSSHDGKITKPLIICEGYDIGGSNDLFHLYHSMSQLDRNGNPLSDGLYFLDKLRNDGWDIIILNLLNNGEAIENNALLIEELLYRVDGEVTANSQNYSTNYHRPILMGISMGGLICRMALCQMEQDGKDHKVEKYISFDVPNKGANVPLGVQAFISKWTGNLAFKDQFRNSLPSFMRSLDPINYIDQFLLKGALTQTSAYQMAATLYGGPINTPRDQFLWKLNFLGNYPKKCRLVGIANGANGIGQTNLWAGKTMFNWEGGGCPIDWSQNILGRDFRVRFCPFTIDEKFWAMPGNGAGVIENTFWGTQLQLNSTKLSSQVPSFAIYAKPTNINANIDHVPGGTNSLYNFGFGQFADFVNTSKIDIHEQKRIIIKECLVPAWDMVCTNYEPGGCNWFYCWADVCWTYEPRQVGCNEWIDYDHTFHFDLTWNKPLGNVDMVSDFCFVPTVGALDINSTDWFANVAAKGQYPHDKNFSPFDAIYWHDRNSSHAHMDFGNDNRNYNQPSFMMEEISPDNLFIQNRAFPVGYKNTFEARGYVAIGRNVDLINNRTPQGDVLLASNSDVTFSVGTGAGNFVYFDDGFDSNDATVDVKYNSYMVNGSCSKVFNTVSTTLPRNQTWNQLRKGDTEEEVANTPKANKVAVTEGTSPQKFDVSSWLQEGKNSQSTFKVDAIPNPFSSETILGFNLSETSVVSLQIFNSRGALVSNVLKENVLVAGNNSAIVSLENQLSGLYIYRLVVNGQNFSGKLIKQ